MKYRIKIETYNDGSKKFYCQLMEGFLFFTRWIGIDYYGDADSKWIKCSECKNREEAIKRIDLHFSLATKSKEKIASIEFEYINK